MSNPIRILVNGAQGKMGSLAVKTLANHANFIIVAELVRGDNLRRAIQDCKPKVVLDLTSAESVYKNSLIAIEENIHVVIGASGLLDKDIKTLTKLCEEKQLGSIIVPNFSIGAVLMMHLAGLAAEWFSEVEVVETHHQKKLDAPSSTALKTVEIIAANRKNPKNNLPLKELIAGVRGGIASDINIHSLRLPGVLARQQILFGSLGETLSISHESIDRLSFMPGVIMACQKVLHLNCLYYGLESLLFN